MINSPTNPVPTDSVPPHLPQYPTRTQLLERHWYAFLKFQQTEIRKRLKSGFGVPKVDVDENTFWSWFLENRLEDGE